MSGGSPDRDVGLSLLADRIVAGLGETRRLGDLCSELADARDGMPDGAAAEAVEAEGAALDARAAAIDRATIALEAEMARTPAAGMAGFAAKARVLLRLLPPNDGSAAAVLAASLAEDIVRGAAP